MISAVSNIQSGLWQQTPYLLDYRSEWLSDMLIERVAVGEEAPQREIEASIVSQSGNIWFRFWLTEPNQMVEKYFGPDGQTLGIYIPLCMPFEEEQDKSYSATTLLLGLWMRPDGGVVVVDEDRFDQAVATQQLTPVQIEQAEYRIRELTTLISQNLFPPALVRNFSIEIG